MSIRVEGLSKKFAGHVAVDKASIEVGTGKLVALLGPSGSGKTTLLRLIAGLEIPDAGRVFFHGDEVTQKSAYERRAGFVFQHYALFQHLSVFDNIAFGLQVRPRATRPSQAEISERVHCLLKLVQLEAFAKRFPSHLSGGQRQRVALARALAIEPRVLLLDEPFGALDAKVRKELRAWLRRFHNETHITGLFVTHDQEEAFEVADEVVILNNGTIQQIGAPGFIQREPANSFVQDFLGLDFQI